MDVCSLLHEYRVQSTVNRQLQTEVKNIFKGISSFSIDYSFHETI